MFNDFTLINVKLAEDAEVCEHSRSKSLKMIAAIPARGVWNKVVQFFFPKKTSKMVLRCWGKNVEIFQSPKKGNKVSVIGKLHMFDGAVNLPGGGKLINPLTGHPLMIKKMELLTHQIVVENK